MESHKGNKNKLEGAKLQSDYKKRYLINNIYTFRQHQMFSLEI